MPEDFDLEELEEASGRLGEEPGDGLFESAQRLKAFDDEPEEGGSLPGDQLLRLMREYSGRTLQDVFNCSLQENREGSCHIIERRFPIQPPALSAQRAYQILASDLTLCYGIGPATANRFAARGINTHHRLHRYGSRFADPYYLRLLDEGDYRRMYQYIIAQKKRYNDPLLFALHNYIEQDRFVFIDIESLGLGGQPLFLIGAGRIQGDELVIRQYLATSLAQEPALLHQFREEQKNTKAIVSFNGKKFDTPFINGRLSYYDLPMQEEQLEFDMYLFARSCFKDTMPRHRLLNYEELLYGSVRDDDVPGEFIPLFYERSHETQNIGPLVPIITHNQEDIVTTYRLFHTLKERWNV